MEFYLPSSPCVPSVCTDSETSSRIVMRLNDSAASLLSSVVDSLHTPAFRSSGSLSKGLLTFLNQMHLMKIFGL